MFSYLNTLRGSVDFVFFVCAVAGITLFMLRSLLLLLGNVFDDVADHDHHDHLEPSFKFLTLHGLTGFLMIFGLLGLGLRQQYNYEFTLAVGFAFVAGICMMLLVGGVFYGASFLTSNGNKFSADETVGLPATVYLRISPDIDGKIQVHVRGTVRELDAQAQDRDCTIESFVHVTIVGVIDDHTVVVAVKPPH